MVNISIPSHCACAQKSFLPIDASLIRSSSTCLTFKLKVGMDDFTQCNSRLTMSLCGASGKLYLISLFRVVSEEERCSKQRGLERDHLIPLSISSSWSFDSRVILNVLSGRNFMNIKMRKRVIQ